MNTPSGQYAQLLSAFIVRALLQELQDVHCSVEVATGQADADCRLMFVPCQHPHFDPCQPQSLNGLLDLVLKSIGERGEAKQTIRTTFYTFYLKWQNGKNYILQSLFIVSEVM